MAKNEEPAACSFTEGCNEEGTEQVKVDNNSHWFCAAHAKVVREKEAELTKGTPVPPKPTAKPAPKPKRPAAEPAAAPKRLRAGKVGGGAQAHEDNGSDGSNPGAAPAAKPAKIARKTQSKEKKNV